MMFQAEILGIAGCLPDKIVTNDDLASLHPDWDMPRIAAKTGIVARHIAAETETACDLAFEAASKLLERSIVPKQEIDYLIVVTQTPDHLLPSNACQLQSRLKLGSHMAALDLNIGCSGFVGGLHLSTSLIQSGQARNVLVITTDTYSKILHPQDRTVQALFGDGAAATLVGRSESEGRIGQFVLGTNGSKAGDLIVPAGGFRQPRSERTAQQQVDAQGCIRNADSLFMDGQAIFTFALTEIPKSIAQLLKKADLTAQQVDWYIFHQANRFMLENLAAIGRIAPDKMVYHLESIGNTVAASIPLAMEHYLINQRIQPGQNLILAGFGVGLSWAACHVVWGHASATS
jgi:3-oxoacyl-[acyl-carrier-protein] synthase-3